MRYSYCETATASGSSPWHIRQLTAKGLKLGGGADTPALCGRTVAWDLNVEFSTFRFANVCQRCVQKYQEQRKEQTA